MWHGPHAAGLVGLSATAWRHSFTLGGRRCPAPTAGTLVAAPGSGAGAEALDDAPAADVAAAADPLAVATSRAEAAVGAALLPEGAAPSPPFLPHPPISATVQSGNASRILCCSLEPDTILRRMSCELQRLNRRAGRGGPLPRPRSRKRGQIRGHRPASLLKPGKAGKANCKQSCYP